MRMLARRPWGRLTLWLAIGAVVVSGGAVTWAASSPPPAGTATQSPVARAAQDASGSNGPPTSVDEANRAQSAPISRVLYELQVRHFDREDCETENGGIIMREGASEEGNDLRASPSASGPTARAAGKGDQQQECLNRFVTARAFCPGGNLRVIGGGARLFEREEAVVIDSYPEGDGSWVVHLERIPVEVRNGNRTSSTANRDLIIIDGSNQVLPETRVEVTAICAEVAHEESDPD